MAISRGELFALLDKHHIPHKTVEHEAAHTVEQAQANRGSKPQATPKWPQLLEKLLTNTTFSIRS